VKREDAGRALADAIREYFFTLDLPDGIGALGFDRSAVDQMVLGTLPQHRVTKLAPLPVGAEELQLLFEKAWKLY
jgi:hydroxyacid-oxoacid transhydrogenase